MASDDSSTRREFVKKTSAAALTASLAGCSTETDESGDTSTETETPPQQEVYRYRFIDAEGFNQVGEPNLDDVPEERKVKPVTEQLDTNWDELILDDHIQAQRTINNEKDPLADVNHDGSIPKILDKTEEHLELLNSPGYKGEIPELGENRYEKIQDEAIEFLACLRGAIKEVTGQSNSASADLLNTNLAEYAAEKIDKVNLKDFNLSTLWTSIQGSDTEIDEKTDLYHPIGLAQYKDEEGNQRIIRAELEYATTDHYTTFPESIYRKGNLGEPFQESSAPVGRKQYPRHHLDAFNYTKGRKLQYQEGIEEGGLEKGMVDLYLLGGMLSFVDDAPDHVGYPEEVETGGDWNYPWEWVRDTTSHVVVSNSFGESVEEYTENPSAEGYKHFEGTSRALFSALYKNGFGQSIAVDGTMEDPKFYNVNEETASRIHENELYDQVTDEVERDMQTAM
ncbi:hypothetical protein GLU60_02195 [Nanohaloarchaea archaeon H01]|nr:hypothetical protein [Nanohaloarchaea archaeon H01]